MSHVPSTCNATKQQMIKICFKNYERVVVVGMLVFHPEKRSSNPAEGHRFIRKLFEKTRNGRGWPLKNYDWANPQVHKLNRYLNDFSRKSN